MASLVLLLQLAGCSADTIEGKAKGGASGTSGATSGGRSGGDAEGGESAAGSPSDGGSATTGGIRGSGGSTPGGGNGQGGQTPSSGGKGGASGGTSGGASGGDASGGAGTDDSCATVADCGNPATTVCDPATQKCVPYQCTATLACATGLSCQGQAAAVTGGACYTACTPFSLMGCPSGRECRQLGLDGTEGICLGRGSAGADQPCDPLNVVATDCVAGHDCVTEGTSATCHRKCNFFAANPGCTTGSSCRPGGICATGAVDAAAIGGDCAAAAMAGTYCGLETGAARGVCLQDSQGLGCYKLCRVASADCGGGTKLCQDVFDSIPEMGACVDRGTCGDGGTGQANCDACVEAKGETCCSVESADCAMGTPCDTLGSCLVECAANDTACVDACVTATPTGVTPYVRYSRCFLGDTDQGFDGACGTICSP